jgi:hypothetical protein
MKNKTMALTISGRLLPHKSRIANPPALVVLVFFWVVTAQADDVHAGAVIEAGRFSVEPSNASLPSGWKPLTFKKIKSVSRYSLVREEGITVVKAEADRSASGLVRAITIDLKEYPWIEWRWKAVNLLRKGDVRSKQGDDYPARLYITFAYDPGSLSAFEKLKYESAKLLYGDYPPLAAINYIWDNRTPTGTVVPNAYTNRLKMIVVESGPAKLNRWVSEARNLYEDYHRAFGEEPPPTTSVAIMTDTDNTGESAMAYYGDIIFKKVRD